MVGRTELARAAKATTGAGATRITGSQTPLDHLSGTFGQVVVVGDDRVDPGVRPRLASGRTVVADAATLNDSKRTPSPVRRGYAEAFGDGGQLWSDARLVHVVGRRHAHLVHLQRHGSIPRRASPRLGTQTACCSRVLPKAKTAQPMGEFEWGMNRHPPCRRAAG